jgi:UDP-glucose 4-epimerase
MAAKVLLTGGAGFIGCNLLVYLLERRDWGITVYDNLSTGSRQNFERVISRYDSRVCFAEGDVRDFASLRKAVAGHFAVVHLAADTEVRKSISQPQAHIGANVEGTLNAIEAARQEGAEKFVFASSNAAVGEQVPPINESMIARPLSPYGSAKLCGEALCSAYYHCYGLGTTALRFANAYGPYSDHKNSVVARFIRRAKAGQTLEIYGDGDQTRDFIYAGDIAQAIDLVVGYDAADGGPCGEVFQIATGRETKITDLAAKISELAGGNAQEAVHCPAVKGEIRQNFSDIGKARRVLGFVPKTDLEAGLREMWGMTKTDSERVKI